MSDRPSGKRYSHLYIERGEPVSDSARARRRLEAVVSAIAFGNMTPNGTYESLRKALRMELGLQFGTLEDFFMNCDLRDLLDSVSVVFGTLPRGADRLFLAEAARVFREEHLAYEIDDRGGVHPLVDADFSRAKQATIVALADKKFAAVLLHFEAAVDKLGGGPDMDSKGAIREVFLALETLFKVVSPHSPARLGGKELDAFRPAVLKAVGDDDVARNVSSKMLASFTDWVDAAHFYRHGQKEHEPSQPPLELAVLLVGQGASYLRWLATLDGKLS